MKNILYLLMLIVLISTSLQNFAQVGFTEHIISENASFSVFAIDLDGDGDIDVLSSSGSDNQISWYENNGSQSFTEHAISTNNINVANSVFAIDIDGDGDIDVLSSSSNDDKIAWYKNNGNQNFTEYTISANADGACSVFAIDLDGDGDTDVLSSVSNEDKIVWYENNGSQSFIEKAISTNADGARSVFAIDVDGDGDIDVLSASYRDDKIAWYENNGSQSFTEKTISANADGAHSVFAIDVDGDSDIDVLSASWSDAKIAWYENNGSQSFAEHTISLNAYAATSVYAIDIDSDDDIDVLSASYGDDKIAWYENNGSQSFTEKTISANADGARSMFVIDVDGDGDIDVLSTSVKDDKIAWYEIQPALKIACVSANTNFIASEDNIMYYQWQVDDGSGFTDIINNSTYSGSTTNNLNITNATLGMHGNVYRCKLTDEAGELIYSYERYLHVTDEATTINTHPSDIITCPNSGNNTLSTSARGSNLIYQWYKNDTIMQGKTSPNVSVGSTIADAGTYYCKVSGDCGSETTDNATISIIPISIITQPVSYTSICPNTGNIELKFEVAGYNVTYQWYKDNSVIYDETDSVLTLTSISDNEGIYYCIANDDCGNMVTSDNSEVVVGGSNTEVYLTNLAFYEETVVVGNDMDEYYGLPSTMSYNTSNPYNLINAGQYVRFKIECKNNLQSGQSIVFGECSITSNSPYITITDSTAGLNNIAWGDKAWSTDEFEVFIDATTPNGHAAVFNFIVEESGNYYETSCIPVLVNPLACINEDYLIDDDNNPDSNGDDDDIIEPNETIEFLPYIDNVSNYDAEITQGQFFNLERYSDIYIWDEDEGISGTVYDWSWWNYSFGEPSPIAAGETHMQPQYDFVFDYNYTDTYKFTMYMIFSGGFILFEGSPDLTLLRFATPVVLNKFYSEIPGSNPDTLNSISEKDIAVDFSVYPNPASKELYLEFNNFKDEANIQLISADGTVAYNKKIKHAENSTGKINVSDFNNGIYVLKIQSGDIIKTKKIIIRK